LRIERWKRRRFFALYDDRDELVAVFVYRKGAEAVNTRLAKLKEVIARFESEHLGVGDDNPTLFFIRERPQGCVARENIKKSRQCLACLRNTA